MRTAQIKQLFRIIGGKPAPKGDNAFSGEGTPFIKMKDLGRAHFSNNLVDIEQRVSDAVAKKEGLNLIRRGSILLPRSGSVALNHRAVLGIDAYMVSHICALEVIDPKEVSNFYAYYYLRSIKMDRISKKTTGLDAITFEDLGKLSIPLPSIDDQIRIAHLLGKVEGLIAQHKQHLQQLNVLLKSVFLVMFDDLKISEGESTLEDCLKIQQGFAFKSEEFIDSGTPIIKIGTVNKGFFDYSTLSFIADNYPEKIRRFEIKPGDLLISLTGTVGKDDYGNTCFVPSNAAHHTYLLNQRVGKLVCDRNVAHPIFIDSLLKLPKVKSALIKQNRGVRQANLSNSDIYGIQLSIPPIDQQRQFAVIVEKVEAIKSSYQKILADLEVLYGALSQQAFKGQLDLSRVPLLGIEPEKEKTVAAEPLQIPAEESLAIHLPDTDSLLAALESAKARKNLLAQWLEAYRGQLDSTPFSVQHFMAAAQNRLAELHPDNDFELSANDYENIKAWVFDALAAGTLTQAFDDAGNRIELKAAQT